MSRTRPAIINVTASTSNSSSLDTNGSTIIIQSPNSAGNPSPSAVTFATNPPPERPPRRSVKRRPPTPGGPNAVNAFQKVAKAQLEESRSTAPLPAAQSSSSPPPVIPLVAFRMARASFAQSTPHSGLSDPTPPLPYPQTPAIDEEGSDSHQTHKPPRPVPSRLNLSAISNHHGKQPTPSSQAINHAPHASTSKSTTPPSPTHIPSQHPPSPKTASSASHPELHRHPSVIEDDDDDELKEMRPTRSSTLEYDDHRDRQSVATSTNMDSPSTKAMLERLLAAPDYFMIGEPKAANEDDGGSDTSGSLKFVRNRRAPAAVYDEEAEEDAAQVQRRVREQRERSKIKKLLGDDGLDDSVDDFSRPRRVEGFWSDPDFTSEVAGRRTRKGSAPSGVPQSTQRILGSGASYVGGDEIVIPASPRDNGYWSSGIPSSPSSFQRPNEDYQSVREHDRLLSPAARPSQDSRHRSTSKDVQPRIPSSPHSTHGERPRVHALDALLPNASVKRSKTVSGAIHSSPLPQAPDELLVPPPRVSSQNALSFHKESKRESRSPNTHGRMSAANDHEAVANGTKSHTSTRVRPSKSSKSLSISKSDPSSHTPTSSPAGLTVEEYKRQILDTRNLAQTSAKERRRLSALQWMIEQTKSVTRSKSSAALVPESPPSSHQSMSPPLPTRSSSREKPFSGLSASASTGDQYLSPGRGRSLTQPLASPLSGASASGSNSSLPSPDVRYGLPQRARRRSRGEPLSPVLASAGPYPDSPGRFSSNQTLPGSPRSDVLNDGKCFAYGSAGSHMGYLPANTFSPRPSVEKARVEKEKSGFVKGIGRKLSKKRVDKGYKGGDGGGYESALSGQEGSTRNRVRGRTEGRSGAESDSTAVRPTRRGHSLDKRQTLKHRKSLRLSIDKFADDRSPSIPSRSHHGAGSPLVHRSASSPGHSSSQLPSSTGSKESKKDGAGGKHFWKFVKRIGSNGGLKDKYHQHSPSSAAPALPKGRTGESALGPDVSGNQRATSSRRASYEELTSVPHSNSVTLARMAASSGLKHASSSADGHNSYYSHPRPQQGVNTRASTPASSDQTPSSRVFHRTHSSRSSASSSVDLGIPPPLPHPPSAFFNHRNTSNRSDTGHYSDGGYRTPLVKSPTTPTSGKSGNSAKTPTNDDWMAIDSVSYTPPSLPAPPRRPKPAVTTDLDEDPLFDPRVLDSSDFDHDSPLIPTFSVDNAINTFKPRKPSVGEPTGSSSTQAPALESLPFPTSTPSPRSTSVPPPPRPPRDSRRPPAKTSPRMPQDSGSGSGSGSGTDTAVPRTTSRSRTRKSSGRREDDGYGAKPPTSAFGPSPGFTKIQSPPPTVPDTPHRHQKLPNASVHPSNSRSQPASPSDDHFNVGYREIGSPRGLSEQEKAARWDALLEKSEKAGGTLHLKIGYSSGELDSDQLTLNSAIVLDS